MISDFKDVFYVKDGEIREGGIKGSVASGCRFVEWFNVWDKELEENVIVDANVIFESREEAEEYLK